MWNLLLERSKIKVVEEIKARESLDWQMSQSTMSSRKVVLISSKKCPKGLECSIAHNLQQQKVDIYIYIVIETGPLYK